MPCLLQADNHAWESNDVQDILYGPNICAHADLHRLLLLWHGTIKLFGFPTPMSMEAPAFIIYIAGPIELIGGVLVMIGLFTRWAAHGSKALFPLVNGGELAALYCFVFLFISAQGSGIWSADESLGNS